MATDPRFWNGRRVLVTGHTGFKGSWLCLWLQSMGASVTGLSRGLPTSPALHALAGVGAGMSELTADVRDAAALARAVEQAEPEVVLHLAAQPMVRRSIAEPAATWEVNVTGTVNVLEAVRAAGCVGALVVVTSDKCYENRGERGRRFTERDPLGGSDPYSSSKAAVELLTAAYRATYFSGGPTRVATARAGNVIGGGDWGEDRLLPDIVRAVYAGEPAVVRNPAAVRPWQHVLCPLDGYLTLAERLFAGEADRAWNFGPADGDARTVGWIVDRLVSLWNGQLVWERDGGGNPPEAAHLALDSGAAERELGWRAAWDLEAALEAVVEWHRAHRAGEEMRAVTLGQIERFAARA